MDGHSVLLPAALLVGQVVLGLQQEKVVQGSYGPNELRVDSSLLLVLVTSTVTALVEPLLHHYSAVEEGRRLNLRGTATLAGLTFTASLCQYEALKRLSFTTVILFHCAAFVPRAAITAIARKQTPSGRVWLFAFMGALGLITYTTSGWAPTSHGTGLFFLVAYLAFDFGNDWIRLCEAPTMLLEASAGPYRFDLSSNALVAVFAAVAASYSWLAGGLTPSLHALFSTPDLLADVSLLTLASAGTSVATLTLLSRSGELTTEAVLTTGCFLSILANALVFGLWIGNVGWLGIGWVASAAFFRFDQPVQELSNFSLLDDEGTASGATSSEKGTRTRKEPRSVWPKYVAMATLPLLLMAPLTILTGCLDSVTTASSSQFAIAFRRLREVRLPFDVDAHIEGGRWAEELHAAVEPRCMANLTTEPYPGRRRVGFVSVPRSGNSYLRTLVERVTGYQTNSVYCDHSLAPTFLGECAERRFFIKTHFPCLPTRLPEDWESYYMKFDSAVLMVRNPLDALASWWHLAHSRSEDGSLNHEAKVELPDGKFGFHQRVDMIRLARRWRDHAIYWTHAPLLRLDLRYEDFRETPIPKMMNLLSFILPEQEAPSLEDLACVVEATGRHEAYHSRKSSDFASWDIWEPSLRAQVLHITRRPFCHFGYDKLLRERLGPLPEMEGFCDKLELESSRDPFEDFGNGWTPTRIQGWQDY